MFHFHISLVFAQVESLNVWMKCCFYAFLGIATSKPSKSLICSSTGTKILKLICAFHQKLIIWMTFICLFVAITFVNPTTSATARITSKKMLLLAIFSLMFANAKNLKFSNKFYFYAIMAATYRARKVQKYTNLKNYGDLQKSAKEICGIVFKSA